MRTDIEGLEQLISLPAGVRAAEWQTGTFADHGGDWWVAAILEVPPEQVSSFLVGPRRAGTLALPPGMSAASALLHRSTSTNELVAPPSDSLYSDAVHGIAPYARSPLLNGQAVQLCANRIYIVLWTV